MLSLSTDGALLTMGLIERRSRSMPMQDRVVNVMVLLQNKGIGERPLCFVTHSMGDLAGERSRRGTSLIITRASMSQGCGT